MKVFSSMNKYIYNRLLEEYPNCIDIRENIENYEWIVEQDGDKYIGYFDNLDIFDKMISNIFPNIKYIAEINHNYKDIEIKNIDYSADIHGDGTTGKRRVN